MKALKTIPASAELIIFDFCDTLEYTLDVKSEWRPGALELLAKLSDRTKVISSDASRGMITSFLKEYETLFAAIYDESHTYRRDGKHYKNLGKICKEFHVKPANAVMIGDSDKDMRSANKYSIPFISVPDKFKDQNYNLLQLLDRKSTRLNSSHRL